jgi:hypothetical protein
VRRLARSGFMLWAIGLVLMSSGCASFSTRGSARTLDAGDSELLASVSAVSSNPLAGPSLNEGEGYHYSGDDGYPLLELGLGYGLSNQIELGARLRLCGDFTLGDTALQALPPALALDTKIQLARATDNEGSLDVAIDPTLSLSYMAGSSKVRPLTFVQLPVLLGYNLSERNQVEFSPQLMMAMPHLGVSARQFIPSLGVAFLHRFESGWGVRPELTAIAPPDVDGTPFRELAFQANFSVLKR